MTIFRCNIDVIVVVDVCSRDIDDNGNKIKSNF